MLHSGFARALYKSGDKVRIQAYLTERGLPLRLATVTAKVFGPTGGLGAVASGSSVSASAVSSLVTSNGDLSPGQAKVELLDPTLLPGQKQVGNLTLADDGSTGGDNEAQDGIYQAEFSAFIPGIYTVNLSVTYTGLFPNNTGVIEDTLTTNVVVGLDQALVAAGVRSAPVSGGLRVRFVPQDIGKNLLGPGQGAALTFAQGRNLLSATVGDYLDGSYRADVSGVDVSQPFDVMLPGSRIRIFDPANANAGAGSGSGGCTVSPTTGPSPLALLLVAAAVAVALRRRRRWPA
jgi:MYXO-CTERM domain-containing protein